MTAQSNIYDDTKEYKYFTISLKEADSYATNKVGVDDRDQGGACGFAWIHIMNIRKEAIKKALLDFGFRRAYPSGLELSVHKYGQSIDFKEAYAQYFAEYMTGITGLPFKSRSRLD